MGRAPGKLFLFAVLALGLTLRLWFLFHASVIAGDTLLYGDIARTWLEHHTYGFTAGEPTPRPTLIRLPGYPLFLLLCFRIFGADRYTSVIVVQIAIDLLGCVLLANLARRLFGLRAGSVTLLLAAFCPFTASYVASPLTETLTLFCLTAAFYALHRWLLAADPWNRWLPILSLALGYSILLRPDQGLLAAAILAAMLWRRQVSARSGANARILAPVAAALLTVLPLVPWTARNWHTFHVVQPLAPRQAVDPGEEIPFGFQRWYRTWAVDFASTEDVYWNYDGAAIQIGDLPTRAFDSPEQYTATEALLADYDATNRPTPALDARFDALARMRITANPLRYYLALPVARLANMLLRPRTEMLPTPLAWWRWQEHPAASLFALVWAALNLAYFVVGVFGLWRWFRRGYRVLAGAMLLYLALRCALLLTLDNSEPRYTLEFFPILILGIAALVPPDAERRTPMAPAS